MSYCNNEIDYPNNNTFLMFLFPNPGEMFEVLFVNFKISSLYP